MVGGCLNALPPNRKIPDMMTREEWLEQMIEQLRPRFARACAPIPEGTRVSCSWPKGRSAAKVIGQCWAPEGRAPEIFISPTLVDSGRVGGVLIHELIHAALGADAGHGPEFRKAALALGLTGKMTATTETPELVEELEMMAAGIGPYPHEAIGIGGNPVKKQTTRMRKVACSCDYTVRISTKWIEFGVPDCPICDIPMVVIPPKNKAN